MSDDEDVSERVIMARLGQGGWQVAGGPVRRILGQPSSRGYVAMSPPNGRRDASASSRRARARSPQGLAAIAIQAREKREPVQEGKTLPPVSAPTPPAMPEPVSVAIDAPAEIKASGARLEDAILAVGAAAALATSAGAVPLLADRDGKPVGKSSWQRRLEGEGVAPFTPHDVKAEGVSDFEGDKRAAPGHRTPGQVAVSDRKPRTVRPTR